MYFVLWIAYLGRNSFFSSCFVLNWLFNNILYMFALRDGEYVQWEVNMNKQIMEKTPRWEAEGQTDGQIECVKKEINKFRERERPEMRGWTGIEELSRRPWMYWPCWGCYVKEMMNVWRLQPWVWLLIDVSNNPKTRSFSSPLLHIMLYALHIMYSVCLKNARIK